MIMDSVRTKSFNPPDSVPSGSLKFCFVMPFHIMDGRGGGAEVQAWLLAKELARRGYGVSYIAQSVQGRAGTAERLNGVDVVRVKQAPRFQWSNGPEYYRVLKKIDPDIVVQRGTSFLTGMIGRFCKKNRRKFVWMCSDNASPVKWFFVKKQIRLNRHGFANIIKNMVFLINSIVNDLSRHYGMKYITHPFTQNDAQYNDLLKNYHLSSHRMISGHDVPEELPPADKRLNDAIVLWVANLGPRKRPELFLELAGKGRDSGFRFVMIGGRPDKDYLDGLFENGPDNLEWLGKLPFEETLTWFDRAAFFVNTSTVVGEGFPNTFIQAWLRGVPVISTGVDPDGVIVAHELGVVCEDLDRILDRMTEYRGSVPDYAVMSDRVREYAMERHSVKAMAERFICDLKL